MSSLSMLTPITVEATGWSRGVDFHIALPKAPLTFRIYFSSHASLQKVSECCRGLANHRGFEPFCEVCGIPMDSYIVPWLTILPQDPEQWMRQAVSAYFDPLTAVMVSCDVLSIIEALGEVEDLARTRDAPKTGWWKSGTLLSEAEAKQQAKIVADRFSLPYP